MIETARLLIFPLVYDDLNLYMLASGRLEKKMRLADTGRTVLPDVRERVKIEILPKIKAAKPENYVYYTFWIGVEKSTRIIVAELGFKGEPSEKGQVEIGYGTMHNYRGKGFMTEAVAGIIGWARKEDGIHSILAETDETNVASIRILEKNNFHSFERKKNRVWWELKLEMSAGSV